MITINELQYIDVTERYFKEFKGDIQHKYYESHEIHDGKIYSKCKNTWNCDCKSVGFIRI